MKKVDLKKIPESYPLELRGAIHSLVFKYNQTLHKSEYVDSVVLSLRDHSISFEDYVGQRSLDRSVGQSGLLS